MPASSGPKDGWKAFVVAICASILQAVVLGINNSFPNFIGDMLSDSKLHTTNSRLALVQACSLGIAGVLAVPAGIFVQRFGTRISSLISSIAVIVCMVITSVGANSGESMIGLYSVPMAISFAFMMSPGATATASWFDRRASLGMGICFTGGGTGSLSIPRIAGALSNSYSWRTSFLILAAIGALGVLASLFICIRSPDSDDAGEETGGADADAQQRAEEGEGDEGGGGHSVPMQIIPTSAQHATDLPQAGHGDDDGNCDGDEANAALPPPLKAFDYHTDKASIRDLVLNCLFTRNFLGLFWCYSFFSLGFYSMLYICVPYASSMGEAGTPYESYAPITVDEASNVFVPLGVMETIGGPVLGWVATRTDERIVFIASMGLLTLTAGYYAMVRSLADHMGLFVLFGTGCTAFFATFGTMIAQRFHGPNLPVIMSCGFSGAAVGGFLGSTLSIEIANSQGGDYTYVTTMIALAYFCAGLVVMVVVQDVEDADALLAKRISRDEVRMGIAEAHAPPPPREGRTDDGGRQPPSLAALAAAEGQQRSANAHPLGRDRTLAAGGGNSGPLSIGVAAVEEQRSPDYDDGFSPHTASGAYGYDNAGYGSPTGRPPPSRGSTAIPPPSGFASPSTVFSALGGSSRLLPQAEANNTNAYPPPPPVRMAGTATAQSLATAGASPPPLDEDNEDESSNKAAASTLGPKTAEAIKAPSLSEGTAKSGSSAVSAPHHRSEATNSQRPPNSSPRTPSDIRRSGGGSSGSGIVAGAVEEEGEGGEGDGVVVTEGSPLRSMPNAIASSSAF